MRTKDRVDSARAKAVSVDEADVCALKQAAKMIRHLPGVLRVKVNREALRLEVLYKHPTEIWLREIHLAVSSLASTMTTLAAFGS